MRIREHQGYTAVASVPGGSGDSEDTMIKPSGETAKPPGSGVVEKRDDSKLSGESATTPTGLVEKRDDSVHPSKASIRVAVESPDAQQAETVSSEDELVE